MSRARSVAASARHELKPRQRFALCVLVLALAAGCGGIVGNDDDDNFSFTSMAIQYDSTLVDEATVVSLLRNLQIHGVFLLPHPCFEMRGDYRRTGAEIIFTASAIATNPACAPEQSAVQYTVNTFGASRGTYRVKVYHNITGTAPKLVTESTVTIN